MTVRFFECTKCHRVRAFDSGSGRYVAIRPKHPVVSTCEHDWRLVQGHDERELAGYVGEPEGKA